MSIRNGEPELDKRLGVYLALIVTTIVTALVLGCGVGLAMSDKPESTGIAVLPAAAAESTPPPAQAAPSINSLTSILPTVTPSSRAATTAAPAGAATPQPSTAAD